MINIQNIEEAKKQIRNNNLIGKFPIIVKAQNQEFNRKILEYGKFDILLSVESTAQNKDTSKYLDSGLNHILARIASRNSVNFGIDLHEIRLLDKKQKSERLEKLIQNIKISRKANAILKLINYKNNKDASSFLVSLGASTQQAKKAVL